MMYLVIRITGTANGPADRPSAGPARAFQWPSLSCARHFNEASTQVANRPVETTTGTPFDVWGRGKPTSLSPQPVT